MAAPERRDAILSAALDVFAEGGFHRSSLDDVAGRAGISKALIYEHFESKRGLHDALLETYVHELLDRVTVAISGTEPGEARMRSGLDGFLEFVEERRDAWRMLIRNSAEVAEAGSFERLFDQVVAVIGARMAEEVPEQFRVDGVSKQTLSEVMARQLLGAVNSLANWWDENREVPRERVLTMAMEFAWLGLDRVAAGEQWPGDPA